MPRIRRIGLWIVLLLGLAALFTWQRKTVNLHGTVFDPPLPAVDFSLLQADGQIFRLKEQRGKIVLLYFGYTFCPDVCPTTLNELSRALQKLDEQQRARVKVVFISVDPARDTPERAQEYARRFSPSFIGLSGSEEQLRSIWNAYGVVGEVQSTDSAAGYLVTHSAHVFLVDPDGYVRMTFPFGTSSDDIAHDLVALLSR